MELVFSKLVSKVRAMKSNSRHCSSLADSGPSSPEAAAQFYWSDARRIHSDPGADLEELYSTGRDDTTHQQSHHYHPTSEMCEDDDDSVFLSSCEQQASSSEDFHTGFGDHFVFDWEEWQIPMEEITLRSMVSCNGSETVYNGYWHGNVQVHTRRMKEVENVCSFLHEVTTLSCIRHENIQLFMGASLDLNQERVAVVMSELKGHTLYTRLHTYGHCFTSRSKITILRQITEGMAYLHAKNIPHGLLTSQSITLHSRVCICLAPHMSHVRNREFQSHQFVYLPPEFVRELYIVHSKSKECVHPDSMCSGLKHNKQRWLPRAVLRTRPTLEADVFAFGTIVYELMTLSHPYKSLPLECMMWRLGNGETQPLNLMRKGLFRHIISKCWHENTVLRPSFQELLISLEQDMTSCDVVGNSLKRSRSLPSIHNSE